MKRFLFRLHSKPGLDIRWQYFSNSFITFFFLSAAFAKQYADIIFLIDSTATTKHSASDRVKHFISQIVEQLDVGTDKYRIGLAQFNGVGEVGFALNSYEKKEEILDHIQRIVLTGDSSQDGIALESLLETLFTDTFGSRINEGTPQTVVIFTSSGSSKNIMGAIQMLEEMGVKNFTVEVEDFDRVETMEIYPSNATYVYGANNIEFVQQRIVTGVEASVQNLYELDQTVPAGMVHQKSKTLVVLKGWLHWSCLFWLREQFSLDFPWVLFPKNGHRRVWI